MDPISKALERARTEHQSVRTWVQPATAESARAPSSGRTTKARHVVELDGATLRRNCLLGEGRDEDPVLVDRYRLLRTRVLQIMKAKDCRSLGITSPGPKAGKTITAVNLALSIVREGNFEVILVDADVRKPSVSAYLGFDPVHSLPEYLTGAVELEELLVEVSNRGHLTVIPGAKSALTDPSPELLKSARMLELLRRFPASRKDTVMIVDLPPILVGDDVLAVAPALDALLMVVDEENTKADDLQRSAELLKGFNLIGSVLNRSAEKSKGFEGYYHLSGTPPRS